MAPARGSHKKEITKAAVERRARSAEGRRRRQRNRERAHSRERGITSPAVRENTMGPGFNRYAIVLSLLAAGAAAGCSGGGSSSRGGASTAPITSQKPT